MKPKRKAHPTPPAPPNPLLLYIDQKTKPIRLACRNLFYGGLLLTIILCSLSIYSSTLPQPAPTVGATPALPVSPTATNPPTSTPSHHGEGAGGEVLLLPTITPTPSPTPSPSITPSASLTLTSTPPPSDIPVHRDPTAPESLLERHLQTTVPSIQDVTGVYLYTLDQSRYDISLEILVHEGAVITTTADQIRHELILFGYTDIGFFSMILDDGGVPSDFILEPTPGTWFQTPLRTIATERAPATCDEARALGFTAVQIARRFPYLDRDQDGVACYGD